MSIILLRNLVLTGLPGCGKTSLGKRLANRLHCPFIDTDAMVETVAGKSIRRIFAEDGETAFRDIETECVLEAAAMKGVVISTGGGVVLREKNMQALQQNGIVLFIDRHPAKILRTAFFDNRPLLRGQAEKLYALHQQRYPLYRAWAEHRVPNTGRLRQLELAVLKFLRKD